MVYYLNQLPPTKLIFDSQVQLQLVDTSFFRAAGVTDGGETPFEMLTINATLMGI